MEQTYTWGDFVVMVANDGTAKQPWGDKEVFRYKVSVWHPNLGVGMTKHYNCLTWGSRADFEAHHDNKHEEMAAMVLDELASAYADPDEFWQTAFGGAKCPSRAEVEQVMDLIDWAKQCGEPLIEVVEELRDKELI